VWVECAALHPAKSRKDTVTWPNHNHEFNCQESESPCTQQVQTTRHATCGHVGHTQTITLDVRDTRCVWDRERHWPLVVGSNKLVLVRRNTTGCVRVTLLLV
jgi:hypothetical protein